MRSLASVRVVLGPSALSRYNLYRSVTINGAAAPGYSTGDALAAMAAYLGRDAAGRLRLRVDRHGAPGAGGGGPDRHRARPRRAVRLPVPGGALRELEHPDPGAALGHGRRPRRDRRDPAGRAELRRLRPDRARGADRARGQERHPDRRVRQGAARAGPVDHRRGDRGRAAALPPGDDDELRLHPRPRAAGDRRRARAP